jgi:hypothetical protein
MDARLRRTRADRDAGKSASPAAIDGVQEVQTTPPDQAPALERLDGEAKPIADSPFPIDAASEPARRTAR